MERERHLTVSGFVVHDGRVALHWHRRIGAWLPAGGHIEAGEDPVQATLREIAEEFAIEAEVMSLAPRVEYDGGPEQLEPPFTILVCPVDGCGRTADGKAVHIDNVYFCRALSGYPGTSYDDENPIVWVDIEALETGAVERDGVAIDLLPDVQALGIEAIRVSERTKAGVG
jgi:8-oxo-dGTP pyrophosphatase MutT (NUDIX family)